MRSILGETWSRQNPSQVRYTEQRFDSLRFTAGLI